MLAIVTLTELQLTAVRELKKNALVVAFSLQLRPLRELNFTLNFTFAAMSLLLKMGKIADLAQVARFSVPIKVSSL